MFLFDKYSLDKNKSRGNIIFHQDILKFLETISKDESIPHIIFHGAEGVGKRTFINSFLEMLYGKSVNNLSEFIYIIKGSGGKENEIIIKQSNSHIVIDPGNNNFDKYLIQNVVKEYAKEIL